MRVDVNLALYMCRKYLRARAKFDFDFYNIKREDRLLRIDAIKKGLIMIFHRNRRLTPPSLFSHFQCCVIKTLGYVTLFQS